MASVSVIILTYNEAANLPACLESLKGLEAEVFVVDSGSTDRTVEIAETFGAHVAVHPFEHYSAQRNWAQAHLPLKTEWILHLDADERLTPELRDRIAAVLASPPQDIAGFLLRRRTIFLGRWIRHGGHYPVYHLRLFRKDDGRCEDRLYDQHFMVDGKTARLEGDMIDVITADLSTWIRRHDRWATLEALEVLTGQVKGQRVRGDLSGTPIEQRRWLREDLYLRAPLFLRAFAYFVYRYFLRLGFLDGKEGLIFHFLQACWYRFLVDAKIYEQITARKEHRKD